MHNSKSRLLSREDAAAFLRDRFNLPCSPQTLARWASEDTGPQFYKALGRALYPENALNAWAKNQLGPLVPSRPARLEQTAN
jgi:hypothetical protein